jgi:Calcineurin-like phosphoesterase
MPATTTANIHSCHNPALSLWQSAMHKVLSEKIAGVDLRGIAATAVVPQMLATTQVLTHFDEHGTFDVPATPVATATAAGTAPAMAGAPAPAVVECAKLAAQIALYETIDPSRAAELRSELQGGTCDPLWAECLATYEAFRLSGKQQPYFQYSSIGDFVLEKCFPDTTTIAIIGDWGTGTNAAVVLLEQIAANFEPSVLLHLGDIYYSGLRDECLNHFTKCIDEVWPATKPLIFTLDGNHDRYAGTNGGYYDLIASLNPGTGKAQPNSYFAMRNNFWQFVAMDTGYFDSDPNSVTRSVTKLFPEETAWHLDKIENNGAGVDRTVNASGVRGTVLLSHNQLFSFTGVGKDAAGRPMAVNPNLVSAFSPVMGAIDLWLWGHEHDLCIFEPYTNGPGQPLPKGRCIGASAIPVYVSQKPKLPANLLTPVGESGPPKIVSGTALGDNGTVLNHCYAIMRLNGPALSIEYYQMDCTKAQVGHPTKPGAPLYVERIEKPAASR